MAGAERLALVLLAAGGSHRFGATDKLLAPLDGRPLIDWAARAGCAIETARRLVVTRPDDAIDLSAHGYERFDNVLADEGMGSSLRLAGQWAEDVDAEALIVLLADMPFVDAAHLQRLLEAYRRDGSRPVFSRAGEGAPVQPPALFPAAFLPALTELSGDRGARSLASDSQIVVAEADRLIDIDTPDDLDRARGMVASGLAGEPR